MQAVEERPHLRMGQVRKPFGHHREPDEGGTEVGGGGRRVGCLLGERPARRAARGRPSGMQWLGARCCCGVRARVFDIAFFGLEEDFPAGARLFRRLAPRLEPGFVTIEHMTIQRMDNVGIVVDDLEAAVAFFAELGLELEGETTVEGQGVDRVVGLDGVRSDIAMMRTPDGHGRLELAKFHTPTAVRAEPEDAPVNTLGIRRIMFAVDDIEDVLARLQAHGAELVGEVAQYEDSYRLCYVRGPEGIIVALAEQIG